MVPLYIAPPSVPSTDTPNGLSHAHPSSETQGQLVGATGFSRAKVYNKNGRAPGHLLLPNKFEKRLKSRSLIGQKTVLAHQKAEFQTLLELVRKE